MASILLHSCCGPCATYTVKCLREEGFQVTAFWYNPNIHPFTEHQQRLKSMQLLAEKMNLPLIIDEGYQMIDYFRSVVGHEGDRCADCYRMRLNRTAQVASDNGFDSFTTTLLISPYQDHELIRQVGDNAARTGQVKFHFRDFRDGFRESHEIANKYGLYRQKYCGCIYSEWEKYGKVKIDQLLEKG